MTRQPGKRKVLLSAACGRGIGLPAGHSSLSDGVQTECNGGLTTTWQTQGRCHFVDTATRPGAVGHEKGAEGAVRGAGRSRGCAMAMTRAAAGDAGWDWAAGQVLVTHCRGRLRGIRRQTLTAGRQHGEDI